MTWIDYLLIGTLIFCMAFTGLMLVWLGFHMV